MEQARPRYPERHRVDVRQVSDLLDHAAQSQLGTGRQRYRHVPDRRHGRLFQSRRRIRRMAGRSSSAKIGSAFATSTGAAIGKSLLHSTSRLCNDDRLDRLGPDRRPDQRHVEAIPGLSAMTDNIASPLRALRPNSGDWFASGSAERDNSAGQRRLRPARSRQTAQRRRRGGAENRARSRSTSRSFCRPAATSRPQSNRRAAQRQTSAPGRRRGAAVMASWLDNLRRASFRGSRSTPRRMAVSTAGAGPITSIPAATCPTPRTWAARSAPGRSPAT